jgi:hypothetical protein
MGWKYVMLEHDMGGGLKIRVPIIFPDKLIHAEIAAVTKLCLRGRNVRTVSAGVIEHIVPIGLGGESETLRMASAIGDADTIKGYSYFHGIHQEPEVERPPTSAPSLRKAKFKGTNPHRRMGR